jgi:hypothetical protein
VAVVAIAEAVDTTAVAGITVEAAVSTVEAVIPVVADSTAVGVVMVGVATAADIAN